MFGRGRYYGCCDHVRNRCNSRCRKSNFRNGRPLFDAFGYSGTLDYPGPLDYTGTGPLDNPELFPGENFMRAQGGCIHSCGWGKKK